MGALLHVLPWVRPWWRYGVLALVGTITSVAVNLAIPLQTSRVIDDGIAVGDTQLVTRVVVTMVVLVLVGMIASGFAAAMAVRMAFNTITDLRRDLYGHTQDFSFANLDRMNSGEILARLTSDMGKVLMVLTMGTSLIAQLPIMFVGALVAIVSIDASLTVIVAMMVPVIGALVWYVLGRSGQLYDAVQTRLDRLTTVLQENIRGVEVVKAFVRQDHQRARFDTVADDLAHQATVVNQLVASLLPTLILVSSLGIAGVLWLGGGNVIAGTLSEGDLVAFISYMAMIAMPMIMFAFIQPLMSSAAASMARIDEVLAVEPAITEPDDGIDLAAADEPGAIQFDDVSFRYAGAAGDEAPELALCNVTLRIRPGTTVAILGATGSGKSTLVHLIPRYYEATSGTVRVGGVDVRRLSRRSLRRNVAVALQTPLLFSGTIADNLRYGRPEATDGQLRAAARTAQAHDFIMAMPEGYDSHVEQGGVNLSGGQRQRLGIARTLVIEPAILVLDDSTSAVDLETEARIQDALQAAIAANRGRTVLLVAQRISTALGADEILVLDDGRLVGHGTHEQLLADNEVYRDIYASQLGVPT